jgi:hypothetical protein
MAPVEIAGIRRECKEYRLFKRLYSMIEEMGEVRALSDPVGGRARCYAGFLLILRESEQNATFQKPDVSILKAKKCRDASCSWVCST